MEEMLALHQLLVDLRNREDGLKRKEDYKEALRIRWISVGVEQAMQTIRQLHVNK